MGFFHFIKIIFGNGYDTTRYRKDDYVRDSYVRDRKGNTDKKRNRTPNPTGRKYPNDYNKNGYTKDGFNRSGFGKDGFNKHGFDNVGYNRRVFTESGWNKMKVNKFTGTKFDKDGYNRLGYDKDGYGKNGYNRIGYDKYGYNSDGYNKNGCDRSGYKKSERPKRENKHRTFLCPSCNQKIRVSLPLPEGIGKCTKCHMRFQLSFDDSGNLLVFSIKDRDTAKNDDGDELTIDKCYSILEINKATATPQVIKTAYKKQMQKYHPDRVAHLGTKIKHIAEKQSKMINLAYEMLQR